MKRLQKTFLMVGAKVLLLGGIVYAIMENVKLAEVSRLLSDIRLGFFCLALGCTFLVPGVLALRLQYVSGVPFRAMLACILKAYFFNNVLPAQIGGDVYKMYFLSKTLGTKSRAVALVTGDRVIGITGLIGMSVFNVIVGYSYFPDSRVHLAIGLYLAILLVFLAGVLLVPDAWLATRHLPPKLAGLSLKIRCTRDHVRQTLGHRFVKGLVLTVMAYLLLIIGNVFAMRALGIRVDVAASFLYVPVISVAAVTLPISFNGLGVRESLFVVFFGAIGYTNEDALTLALIGLVGMLAVAAAGGILVLIRHEPVRRIRQYESLG